VSPHAHHAHASASVESGSDAMGAGNRRRARPGSAHRLHARQSGQAWAHGARGRLAVVELSSLCARGRATRGLGIISGYGGGLKPTLLG
jgi:hypothetical protein